MRPPRAIAMFTEVADGDPKDVLLNYWRARVHTRLARVYSDRGDHATALAHASNAVQHFARRALSAPGVRPGKWWKKEKGAIIRQVS